jgi:A/G-specific adenine glycosylase
MAQSGRYPPDAGVAVAPEHAAAIQSGLLRWYGDNARDLPWRRTRDPYRILVSEVMLQQTQVDRVIPYFDAFLTQFPDEQALARASTAEVIRLWRGLGYNRRAVNLQRAVAAVIDEHGGVWPREIAALIALPGIGPYTAGAIACFAFEQDVPFIDTNMRRVLHRLFLGPDLPEPLATDRVILGIASRVIPAGAGWTWNQALIEFGALQCTARRPACVICPLQRECRAYPAIQGAIAALPKGSGRKQEGVFEGSSRWYRGRIIDALRDAHAGDTPGVPLDMLGPLVRPDYSEEHRTWLTGLVADLARDGLAAVAEERPAYDGAPTISVRLPD